MPIPKWTLNPYILIPLVLGIADFAPHSDRSLKSMLLPGAAAYDVDYELAAPTPRLVQLAFGDSIRTFSGRPTLVLLGNSVVQGRGALDKQALNSALAVRRDVINAALSGEHLISSTALAAYAIESLPADRLPSVVDVVLVYPVTRFYAEGGYWVFGDAVAGLCRRSALMKDLPECAEAKPEPWIHDVLRNAKNRVLSEARCLATQEEFFETLKYGDFRCQRLFQRENVTAGFLNEYRRTLGDVPFSRHSPDRRRDAEPLFLEGSAFADSSRANEAVAAAVGHLSSLKRLLALRGIPSRFSLIIPRESPKFLDVLAPAEREALSTGAENIAGAARRQAPWIRVEILGPYAPNDYFDQSHLRESGQLRLAEDILRLTGPEDRAQRADGSFAANERRASR